MFDIGVVINWLVERAKRTPYYHLDGYMRRWWLVPYRREVKRIEPKVDPNGPLVPGKIWWAEDHPFDGWVDDLRLTVGVARYIEVTDGTGPVPFRSRPIAWLLQRFDIAVRIHEILRSDTERHPHSHPWSYLTIILRGNGYIEQRFDDEGELIEYKFHGPGAILWRPAGSLHRLTMVDGPVTTLFITFKKRGTWGFQVDGKVIPHREYPR